MRVAQRRAIVAASSRARLAAGSAAASLVGLAGNHVSMARAQGLQAAAAVGARNHYHYPGHRRDRALGLLQQAR